MIGQLPTTLKVGDRELPILSTDYRTVLVIIQACEDPELTEQEKVYIMIDALLGWENIRPDEAEEAMNACNWFIDGGKEYDGSSYQPKLMDWGQDEQMIFSAVNHVAGKELRTSEYCHWWTFLGYFSEIQDGLFSYVVAIRQKKAKHKKLDKTEEEFYQQNRDIINIKKRYTAEEKAEIDRINSIFK